MDNLFNVVKGIETQISSLHNDPSIKATADDLRDKACEEMYVHIKKTIFANAKDMVYMFDIDTNSVKLRTKLIKKLNDDGLDARFDDQNQLVVNWE